MPVMDHLRELRSRVIKVLVIISIGTVLGWIFYPHILDVLKRPYCSLPYQRRFPGNDRDHCNLIFTGPLDGFTIRLKVGFIAALFFTGPLWLYQIWAFVTPGLR